MRIQRCFLWGGSKGARKIPWVQWSDVCKPKSEGGLGIRDLKRGGFVERYYRS